VLSSNNNKKHQFSLTSLHIYIFIPHPPAIADPALPPVGTNPQKQQGSATSADADAALISITAPNHPPPPPPLHRARLRFRAWQCGIGMAGLHATPSASERAALSMRRYMYVGQRIQYMHLHM
jgi:hypothetical protein